MMVVSVKMILIVIHYIVIDINADNLVQAISLILLMDVDVILICNALVKQLVSTEFVQLIVKTFFKMVSILLDVIANMILNVLKT